MNRCIAGRFQTWALVTASLLLATSVSFVHHATASERTAGPDALEECGTLPDGPTPRPKCELWKSRYNQENGRSRAFDVIFSPDGSRVFVTGEGGFDGRDDSGADVATVAYDAVTGDELWVARHDAANGFDAGFAIAVSPDGSRVFATGLSGSDYVTLAYDAGSGGELWMSRHDAGGSRDISYDIAVSPDGTRVFITGTMLCFACVRDIPTVAFDAATGEKLWVSVYAGPAGLADNGASIAVSPDGGTVYVVGESHNGSTPEWDLAGMDLVVVAYDAQQGTQLWVTRYDNPAGGQDSSSALTSALEVSPDGTRLFVIGTSGGAGTGADYLTVAFDAGSGGILWEARYDGPLSGYDGAWAAGLSPDASTVYVTGESGEGIGSASTDVATVAYDAGSGGQLWEARYDGPANEWDRGISLAVASSGKQVIVGGQSNIGGLPDTSAPLFGYTGDMVTIGYDAATGTQIWNETYNGPIGGDSDGALAIAASPDASTVVTTGWSAPGPLPASLVVTDGVLPYVDYMTIAYDISGDGPP